MNRQHWFIGTLSCRSCDSAIELEIPRCYSMKDIRRIYSRPVATSRKSNIFFKKREKQNYSKRINFVQRKRKSKWKIFFFWRRKTRRRGFVLFFSEVERWADKSWNRSSRKFASRSRSRSFTLKFVKGFLRFHAEKMDASKRVRSENSTIDRCSESNDDDEDFSCRFCPFYGQNKADFDFHHHVHHQHVCSQCLYILPSYFLLELHVEENHCSSRQTFYRCLIENCKNTFPTRELRFQHLNEEHKSIKDRFWRNIFMDFSKTNDQLSQNQSKTIETKFGWDSTKTFYRNSRLKPRSLIENHWDPEDWSNQYLILSFRSFNVIWIMSDIEMDEAPRGSDEVDLNKSLQEVLKSAARSDGLSRGLRGKQKKVDHESFNELTISRAIFRIGQSFGSSWSSPLRVGIELRRTKLR